METTQITLFEVKKKHSYFGFGFLAGTAAAGYAGAAAGAAAATGALIAFAVITLIIPPPIMSSGEICVDVDVDSEGFGHCPAQTQ